MTEATKEKILEIIVSEAKLDPDSLDLSATLDEIGIDSLSVIEIAYKLEEEYDIYIPFDSADFKAQNLQGLVDTVNKLVVANQSDNA